MKSIHIDPYSTHHDIALLLPWYVNHSLRGTELESVEKHLQICLSCRRELANLQKISVAVRQEGAFDSAALVSFANLKSRIHNADKAEDGLSSAINVQVSKLHGKFNLKFPVMARTTLALAASIVLAILITGHFEFSKLVSNDFRTLSDPEVSPSGKNEIRVIFTKNTGRQQLDAILAKVQGRIIAGPTTESVYTVRIDIGLTAPTVQQAIAQLRQDKRVLFAEPTYALLSSDQVEPESNL